MSDALNMKTPGLRSTLLTAAAFAALATMAGCSGGGGGDNAAVPPPSVIVTGAQRFGLGFANKFNANANSDPVAIAANDIVGLDITADPLDVP